MGKLETVIFLCCYDVILHEVIMIESYRHNNFIQKY